MKTAKGTEYPISIKEYPLSKERKYDLQERLSDYAIRSSYPWKLDLSVGYWMLKRGRTPVLS